MDNKTIIVSNRLPLQLHLSDGQLKMTPSVGGLATGMKSDHKDEEGLWIGWSGLVEEDLDQDTHKDIDQLVAKEHCATVSLTEDDVNNFYIGISNRTLWALVHYCMEDTEFEEKYG